VDREGAIYPTGGMNGSDRILRRRKEKPKPGVFSTRKSAYRRKDVEGKKKNGRKTLGQKIDLALW